MASENHHSTPKEDESSVQTQGNDKIDLSIIEEEVGEVNKVRRAKENVRKSSHDVRSNKSLQIGANTNDELLKPRRHHDSYEDEEENDLRETDLSSMSKKEISGKDVVDPNVDGISNEVLRPIEEIVSNKADETDLDKQQVDHLNYLRKLFKFVGGQNGFCGFYQDGGIRFLSKPKYRAFMKSFGLQESTVDSTTGIVSNEIPLPDFFGPCYTTFTKELRCYGFYFLPKTSYPTFCHHDFTRNNPDLHKMAMEKKAPTHVKKPSAAKKGTGSKKGATTTPPLALEQPSNDGAGPSDPSAGDSKPSRELLISEIQTIYGDLDKAEESIASIRGRVKNMEELAKQLPSTNES